MCHIGAVNNFPRISLDFVVKIGYIIRMIKNGKKQNVVVRASTTISRPSSDCHNLATFAENAAQIY